MMDENVGYMVNNFADSKAKFLHTLESVIEKYDHDFPESDIIDPKKMMIVKDNGQLAKSTFKARKVGTSMIANPSTTNLTFNLSCADQDNASMFTLGNHPVQLHRRLDSVLNEAEITAVEEMFTDLDVSDSEDLRSEGETISSSSSEDYETVEDPYQHELENENDDEKQLPSEEDEIVSSFLTISSPKCELFPKTDAKLRKTNWQPKARICLNRLLNQTYKVPKNEIQRDDSGLSSLRSSQSLRSQTEYVQYGSIEEAAERVDPRRVNLITVSSKNSSSKSKLAAENPDSSGVNSTYDNSKSSDLKGTSLEDSDDTNDCHRRNYEFPSLSMCYQFENKDDSDVDDVTLLKENGDEATCVKEEFQCSDTVDKWRKEQNNKKVTQWLKKIKHSTHNSIGKIINFDLTPDNSLNDVVDYSSTRMDKIHLSNETCDSPNTRKVVPPQQKHSDGMRVYESSQRIEVEYPSARIEHDDASLQRGTVECFGAGSATGLKSQRDIVQSPASRNSGLKPTSYAIKSPNKQMIGIISQTDAVNFSRDCRSRFHAHRNTIDSPCTPISKTAGWRGPVVSPCTPKSAQRNIVVSPFTPRSMGTVQRALNESPSGVQMDFIYSPSIKISSLHLDSPAQNLEPSDLSGSSTVTGNDVPMDLTKRSNSNPQAEKIIYDDFGAVDLTVKLPNNTQVGGNTLHQQEEALNLVCNRGSNDNIIINPREPVIYGAVESHGIVSGNLRLTTKSVPVHSSCFNSISESKNGTLPQHPDTPQNSRYCENVGYNNRCSKDSMEIVHHDIRKDSHDSITELPNDMIVHQSPLCNMNEKDVGDQDYTTRTTTERCLDLRNKIPAHQGSPRVNIIKIDSPNHPSLFRHELNSNLCKSSKRNQCKLSDRFGQLNQSQDSHEVENFASIPTGPGQFSRSTFTKHPVVTKGFSDSRQISDKTLCYDRSPEKRDDIREKQKETFSSDVSISKDRSFGEVFKCPQVPKPQLRATESPVFVNRKTSEKHGVKLPTSTESFEKPLSHSRWSEQTDSHLTYTEPVIPTERDYPKSRTLNPAKMYKSKETLKSTKSAEPSFSVKVFPSPLVTSTPLAKTKDRLEVVDDISAIVPFRLKSTTMMNITREALSAKHAKPVLAKSDCKSETDSLQEDSNLRKDVNRKRRLSVEYSEISKRSRIRETDNVPDSVHTDSSSTSARVKYRKKSINSSRKLQRFEKENQLNHSNRSLSSCNGNGQCENMFCFKCSDKSP